MTGAVPPDDGAGGDVAISSRRAIGPMMWVLAGLSTVELLVVHALVALWWPELAIGLSAVTTSGLVWLVVMIRSLATRPSLVGRGRLLLRCGRMRAIAIPAEAVARIRTEGIDEAAVKAAGVLNLALIAFPNVVVELDPAMRAGRRRVSAVAHRVDDLAAFVAAAEAVSRRA